MPRYRFNWTNLDDGLLRALGSALQLQGDPSYALRSAYGARPRVDFVRDAWPVLLDHWLSGDRRATKLIASSLRQRGVGNVSLRDDHEFLTSVRNTSGMRQVVLERFIERGEQSAEDRHLVRSLSVDTEAPPVAAEPARPEPVDPPMPQENGDQHPSTDDMPESMKLMMFLAEALVNEVGTTITLDKDGDLAIPSGSAMVYVSVIDEPPLVRVFSPMVVDVPQSYELLTLLNTLNTKVPFGRFLHTNEAVLLEHSLLPTGLSAQEVAIVVNSIRSAADHFDHQIRERFGGSIAMMERAEDEIDV